MINERIWTQPAQIEEKLADLNGHRKTTRCTSPPATSSRRSPNTTKQSGNIAEKYHFLIIADFPNSFNSETAIKRLLSIVQSEAALRHLPAHPLGS
ncbi:MAG: hypothetical protein R3F11_17710 [Verrucomicrobiales bacterium]